MANRKSAEKFNTAAACRAKASALRTVADQAGIVESKSRMLRMAQEWDALADAYDALSTVEPSSTD